MKPKKIGLAGQVLIGITVLFLLITVTTSIVSAWNLNRSLTREFRIEGTAIANSIANSSVELLLARDGSSLQAMVDEFLEIPGVGYVFVVDGDQEIVAHTFVPAVPRELVARAVTPDDAARQSIGIETLTIPDIGDYLDVTAPILAGVAGVVHVGMDRSVIQADVRSAVVLQNLFMLAIFVVSMALAYVHVTRVARPLGVLTAHANQVATQQRLREREFVPEGDNAAPDVDPAVAELAGDTSGDEVGELAAAFQHMEVELLRYIGNLRRAHLELAEHNRTLEDKVGARTRELQDKNGELESALDQLKQAQDQIVVQEKMASLGALTAGIAHEIKNPLNFINNFAQLADEIAQEIHEAVAKAKAGTDHTEEIQEAVETLQMNVRKIHEHGRRADSIVKNMLLHSRGTSGEFQQTDINALLDQYVGLAYHGLRAQDQTFNATIEKDYDAAAGNARIVPGDLSRAFLNVLTNACYAINEKKKHATGAYSPVLSLRTKAVDDTIEVRVRDNGDGVPQSIRDKVFNPFFTTKPPGSGTGLGLSMTYDIVVRQHKGAIRLESEPGAFTEFILTIPRDPAAGAALSAT